MFDKIFGLIKKLLGIGMPCAFNFFTGLYCPGCGGTRAVKALLHGNLRMSFQYHPLVIYAVLVILLELATWAAAKVFHRPSLHIRRYNLFLLIGAGLIVGNWVYKNYMLVFGGVDLLPPF